MGRKPNPRYYIIFDQGKSHNHSVQILGSGKVDKVCYLLINPLSDQPSRYLGTLRTRVLFPSSLQRQDLWQFL